MAPPKARLTEAYLRGLRNGLLPNGGAARNSIYRIYKNNARRKNRPFELTLEQAEILFKAPCFYCGSPELTNRYSTRNAASVYDYNGIDRVENDGGYIVGNVVTACKFCNMAKREMTVDQFLQWARRLVAHQEVS